MGRVMTADGTAGRQRIDWVDYAKGFCIIFVVMMHSTLGVGHAVGQEGWLHTVVAFAKPFRMPDFFLISGLFLAQVIDRDWRTYLDRKVVHFVYFYLLWTAIQFAFKAPMFIHEHGPLGTLWLYVESFWEPFGTLWFIYLLPIFFVTTKLAHGLRIPPLVVWLAGAALEIAHIHTGATVIDEFASRFVYFYTGYLFAPRIFAFAKEAQARPEAALAGLTIWGLLNGVLVFNGLAGACARVAGARPARRRRGRRAGGAAGEERPVQAAALLRQELDRHLPRILPADGASRMVLLKTGMDHRCRDDLRAGDARRRGRRARLVLGGAVDLPALPVRAAAAVLARAEEAAHIAAGGIVP